MALPLASAYRVKQKRRLRWRRASSQRYPGQYYDAESGLNYNYFRDYDPATGRYIESDPIGLLGGNSTYGYVESNPFTNVDGLGLKSTCGKDDKKCPYTGRYQPCCKTYSAEGTSIGNWIAYKTCKWATDRSCKAAGAIICCQADFNACSGGMDLNDTTGGSDPQKYIKCKTAYLSCMAGK